MSIEMIYSNGIDVDTGDYAIPPIGADELDELIRGERAPENIGELEDFLGVDGARQALERLGRLVEQVKGSAGRLVRRGQPHCH